MAWKVVELTVFLGFQNSLLDDFEAIEHSKGEAEHSLRNRERKSEELPSSSHIQSATHLQAPSVGLSMVDKSDGLN